MLTFSEFSEHARGTDNIQEEISPEGRRAMLLAGVMNAAGAVARVEKHRLRNGRELNDRKAREDLLNAIGTLLWYSDLICKSYGFELADAANSNMTVRKNRWKGLEGRSLLDPRVVEANADTPYKFDRVFDVEFRELQVNKNGEPVKSVSVLLAGEQVGDTIDDNESQEDFYRYHDVLHLGYIAHFGWSPVFRKLLKLKRKDAPKTDREQDGAKAIDTEEVISRLIFVYFHDNDLLENVNTIDSDFLRILSQVVSGRESSFATEYQWEEMLFNTADVLRSLINNSGGIVKVDQNAGKITYMKRELS
ncbi:MAG: hypothetical protein JJU18_03920 [Oceanicaulis sp.]|nr:hypothetical protein [Oceanicaulis sp.]